MNTNNNLYTIVYATLMVVATAAILAFVSMALKERQQKNIDMETQLSILSAVSLAADANSADDKIAYVQNEYDKYIKNSYLVNYKGETVPGDAFTVSLKSQYDLMKQITRQMSKGKLPSFLGGGRGGRRGKFFGF